MSRVAIRVAGQNTSCDSCEVATAERRELDRRVQTGEMSLTQACSEYRNFVRHCSGLFVEPVRFDDTDAGKLETMKALLFGTGKEAILLSKLGTTVMVQSCQNDAI